MPTMPIDVKKLLDSVANLGQERDMPVNIDLIFDVTANDKLINVVLEAFAQPGENALVRYRTLEMTVPEVEVPADLCVVVGGDSLLLGDVASAARAKGIPAVVVISRGETFFAQDSAAAQELINQTLAKNSASTLSGSAMAPTVGKGIDLEDIIDVDLSANVARPLEELATWIVTHVQHKRISLAARFVFLRHALAVELAKHNTIQNGAIGLVFFVPGADMPVITLNQAKMVLQIAAVYGRELDKDRISEVVAVVAGGFGCRALARKLVAQVPVLSWAIKPAVASFGTMAMAIAAIEYFEEDGKLKGVSALVDKAADYAMAAASKGAGLAGEVISKATSHADVPTEG